MDNKIISHRKIILKREEMIIEEIILKNSCKTDNNNSDSDKRTVNKLQTEIAILNKYIDKHN